MSRLVAEGVGPVLDVGCGDGWLRDQLPPGWPVIGVDVDGWAGVDVLADAAALPVRTGSCGAVAALQVLYLLDDPVAAVAEAHRVLRPGGWFVASTTARDDSPELLALLPPQPPTAFDAEEAADVVATAFGADAVEVDAWEEPGEHLATAEDAAAHLAARGVELDLEVPTPVTLTRRGVLVRAVR